jgi:hypothetical protein
MKNTTAYHQNMPKKKQEDMDLVNVIGKPVGNVAGNHSESEYE